MLNKKIIILILLVVFSGLLGYSFSKKDLRDEPQVKFVEAPILRFAIVTDSENENDLLSKALNQAKGNGVNFVIGLGDFTSLGTTGELTSAKQAFGEFGLTYYATAGDRDLWDSRNQGRDATTNFNQAFGKTTQIIDKEGIQFVILHNSDIYKGIDSESWNLLNESLSKNSKLTFVFAHKTPFHPQSAHVMGEQTARVRKQANEFMNLMEGKNVDGFFSGDLHFFARFNSPKGNVKMTTIGAVNSERNFQGPRFAIVTVYSDYSWSVDDVEIR